MRKRQDLSYLKALASGAERSKPGQLAVPRDIDQSTAKEELEEVVQKATVVVPTSADMDLSFLQTVPPMPVCGLMDSNGDSLHPPGVHQKGGYATTSRTFGGCQPPKDLIRRVLKFFPKESVEAALEGYVYTHGTAEGFVTRMREQMSRKTVPVTSYPLLGKGIKVRDETVMKALERLLPLKGELPDWSRDVLDQVLEVETSKISSAGAPYWRDKPAAMKHLMEVGLPIVVEAIQGGPNAVSKLWKEQPEMFLVECKNKLDRYEIGKLQTKCRPYFGLPFHWQVLFSVLSQPFSKALALFHEHPTSANAYGLSMAHGGGQKMVEWARRTKEGEMRFYCYGDDSDVYWRDSKGLWRASPDFKQMDGSVDAELIDLVLKYIIKCFKKANKKRLDEIQNREAAQFWTQVTDEWWTMAVNPYFLVHGETVYRKREDQKHSGLMTGVVGTTLFDTAKAILAYESFRMEWTTTKDRSLLTAKGATNYFAKLGLTIKEGTWAPELVYEHPTPGQLFSNNKFLGMRLLYREGPKRVEPVPYLDDEEWLQMVLSPRDDPLQRAGSRESYTTKMRTLFDRARGYLVTGAFTSPRISALMYSLIEEVPPEAILMSVQADGGRGEKPEWAGPLGAPGTGEDFSYPTSEGVPTIKWCEDLYFSPDNQWGEEWTPVFPTLKTEIQEWHEIWRARKPRMQIKGLKGVPEGLEQPPQKEVLEPMIDVDHLEGPARIETIAEEVGEVVEMEPIVKVPLKRAGRSVTVEAPRNMQSHHAKVCIDEGKLIQQPGPKRMLTFEEAVAKRFAQKDEYVRSLDDWVKLRHLVDADSPYSEQNMAATADVILHQWARNQDSFPKGVIAYTVPVTLLSVLSQDYGLEPDSMAERLRKLGYYVIGSGPSRVVMDRPVAAPNEGEARQVDEQRMENENRYAKAAATPTLKKIVQQAREHEPVQVPLVARVVDQLVPMKPVSRLPGSSHAEYLYKVAAANARKVMYASEVLKTTNGEAKVATKLFLDGVEIASREGPSKGVNQNLLAEAVLSKILRGDELPQKAVRRKEQARRKRVHNWIELADADVRAEIFASVNQRRVAVAEIRKASVVARLPRVFETGGKTHLIEHREGERTLRLVKGTKDQLLRQRPNETLSRYISRLQRELASIGLQQVEIAVVPLEKRPQFLAGKKIEQNKNEGQSEDTSEAKEKWQKVTSRGRQSGSQ